MENKTLIRATIITLVLVACFTVLMMVLVGKNGLINKEIERYNETHAEQNNDDENNDDRVVRVDK